MAEHAKRDLPITDEEERDDKRPRTIESSPQETGNNVTKISNSGPETTLTLFPDWRQYSYDRKTGAQGNFGARNTLAPFPPCSSQNTHSLIHPQIQRRNKTYLSCSVTFNTSPFYSTRRPTALHPSIHPPFILFLPTTNTNPAYRAESVATGGGGGAPTTTAGAGTTAAGIAAGIAAGTAGTAGTAGIAGGGAPASIANFPYLELVRRARHTSSRLLVSVLASSGL